MWTIFAGPRLSANSKMSVTWSSLALPHRVYRSTINYLRNRDFQAAQHDFRAKNVFRFSVAFCFGRGTAWAFSSWPYTSRRMAWIINSFGGTGYQRPRYSHSRQDTSVAQSLLHEWQGVCLQLN